MRWIFAEVSVPIKTKTIKKYLIPYRAVSQLNQQFQLDNTGFDRFLLFELTQVKALLMMIFDPEA